MLDYIFLQAHNAGSREHSSDGKSSSSSHRAGCSTSLDTPEQVALGAPSSSAGRKGKQEDQAAGQSWEIGQAELQLPQGSTNPLENAI